MAVVPGSNRNLKLQFFSAALREHCKRNFKNNMVCLTFLSREEKVLRKKCINSVPIH